MDPAPPERRLESRTRLHSACKVLHYPSGRYLSGTTIDSSSGGLQVRLDCDPGVLPGDRLLVGLATPGLGLLRYADLVDFRVSRAVRAPSGHVVVGLRMAAAPARSQRLAAA